jgi:hypothetical protein
MQDFGFFLQELFEGLVTWVWERFGPVAGVLFGILFLFALVGALIGAISLWNHWR